MFTFEYLIFGIKCSLLVKCVQFLKLWWDSHGLQVIKIPNSLKVPTNDQ